MEYDVVVIGSGSGMTPVSQAVNMGLDVALVERGPVGGTCLNLGCIPSKMLIYPADVAAIIQESHRLGIKSEIKNIDFSYIMDRMRKSINSSRSHMQNSLRESESIDFYEEQVHFVDDYTLETSKGKIKGKKIFIAAGARPLIPDIVGIDDVDYLTNESILELEKAPDSLVIVGGGYIAAEYGHFFAAMGTDVTILQRGPRLVPSEEPEISELLKKKLETRMKISTNTEVTQIRQKQGEVWVYSEGRRFVAQKVMMATGRKPNSDILKVENTGVKTKKGFIEVDEYYQTAKQDVYAFGDIIGKAMFRHAANREASIATRNALTGQKFKMDYLTVPHAIFTHPQIASVGLTEEVARRNHRVLTGMAKYSDIAKGEAMVQEDTFAKAIVAKDSLRLLGFHIIGPSAPVLIQEVINSMHSGNFAHIANSMHIHPALTELIMATLQNLEG